MSEIDIKIGGCYFFVFGHPDSYEVNYNTLVGIRYHTGKPRGDTEYVFYDSSDNLVTVSDESIFNDENIARNKAKRMANADS